MMLKLWNWFYNKQIDKLVQQREALACNVKRKYYALDVFKRRSDSSPFAFGYDQMLLSVVCAEIELELVEQRIEKLNGKLK